MLYSEKIGYDVLETRCIVWTVLTKREKTPWRRARKARTHTGSFFLDTLMPYLRFDNLDLQQTSITAHCSICETQFRGCALILAKTWPEKIGKGLIFISLNVEPATPEAARAAVDALRTELEAKGVSVKEDSWGYRLLVVDDPDGNQLFFNYPA